MRWHGAAVDARDGRRPGSPYPPPGAQRPRALGHGRGRRPGRPTRPWCEPRSRTSNGRRSTRRAVDVRSPYRYRAARAPAPDPTAPPGCRRSVASVPPDESSTKAPSSSCERGRRRRRGSGGPECALVEPHRPSRRRSTGSVSRQARLYAPPERGSRAGRRPWRSVVDLDSNSRGRGRHRDDCIADKSPDVPTRESQARGGRTSLEERPLVVGEQAFRLDI